MKRKIPILMLLCMVASLFFISGASAHAWYVGNIDVGNKVTYTATCEYQLNDGDKMVCNVDFTVEVVSVGSDTDFIGLWSYTDIVVNIKGRWSGE